MEKKICCICGNPIEGWGNNPWGAMWLDKDGNIVTPTFKDDDECCSDCDAKYVIPGRIYNYKLNLAKEEKDGK